MASSTYSDEIMRVIALSNTRPFIDVVNVQLSCFFRWRFADGATVPVPSLYQFSDSFPSFATITVPPAFPVWRFTACHSIGWISFSGSVPEILHCFWCKFRCRIKFWMVTPILSIAILVTKLAVAMRESAAVNFAAVRTHNFYLVSSLSQLASTLYRTSKRLITIFWIQLSKVPLGHCPFMATAFADIGDLEHLTSLIGLGISVGRLATKAPDLSASDRFAQARG